MVSAPIRMSPELAEKVAEAKRETGLAQADILRLALAVGLEDLRKVGFDLAKLVSDAARPEISQHAGVVPFERKGGGDDGAQPLQARLTDMPRQWIDLLGGVAAGAPLSSHVMQEPVEVEKHYDADHYALRVFGASMAPKIKDGSTIIVKRWPIERGVPKKGTIVVWSDGTGSSLKEFGYRKAKAGEEADTMGNVPVLRSLNPAFPEVKIMDGGRIDAVLVEAL
jgi:SOS-response transcriptional repressor LexA